MNQFLTFLIDSQSPTSVTKLFYPVFHVMKFHFLELTLFYKFPNPGHQNQL